MSTISRRQVIILLSFLMIVLSTILDIHGALGARLLYDEKMAGEDLDNKAPVWNESSFQNKNNSNKDGDEGFFATINREVPSCPDPLHNR